MTTNSETRAWRVLLAAFIVFLVLFGSAAYWVYWFAFESYIPLKITVAAARGTARIVQADTMQEIAVTEIRDDVESGITAQTDVASQSVLTFANRKSSEIALSVVLLNDTMVTIDGAESPRFDLNKNELRVSISSTSGRLEIDIPQATSNPVELTIDTPQAKVTIQEAGSYALTITQNLTSVTAFEGSASVVKTDAREVYVITADTKIVAESGLDELSYTIITSLVDNDSFSTGLAENSSWIIENIGAPEGSITNKIDDGRMVVVVNRSASNWPGVVLGHGETGLHQTLDLNVQDYSVLEIRGKFQIEEQTLPTCGQQGSECPVMIRMEYIDIMGVPREYIRGFYAVHDPAISWPLRCDTCAADHERINPNIWYTFRSGNLLGQLPEEQRPATILQLRFYSSGHGYLIDVDEMGIIVSQ